MSWVLLLIQLIPAVIKVIGWIRELIAKLPRAERPGAWKELRQIAKQNVRKRRSEPGEDRGYMVRTSEQTVLEELEALHEKLKLKVGA